MTTMMKFLLVPIFALMVNSLTVFPQNSIKYEDFNSSSKVGKGNITITDIKDQETADKLNIKNTTSGGALEGDYDKIKKEKNFIPLGNPTSITVTKGTEAPFTITIDENATTPTPSGSNRPKVGPNGQVIDDKKSIYSGIAFHDATTIYNLIKTGRTFENDTILKILKEYGFTDGADFKKSPFIQNLERKNFDEAFRTPENNGRFESGAGGVLKNLSGIDVTKFVQGFSDFLRDRIKAELTIAYIDKLKKTINEKEELKYLLPKTFEVFNNGDPYNLPTLGPMYKAAFAEDLKNMMLNFENMVNNMDKYAGLRKNEAFQSFVISYKFVDYSAKGYHPIEILRLLDNEYAYCKDDDHATVINYSLSVLNMFSQHLKTQDDMSKWISKNSINLVNKDFMNIFFSLLHQKYPLLLDPNINAQPFVKNLYRLIFSINNNTVVGNGMDNVYNFLILGNNIDRRIDEFRKLTDNPTASTTATTKDRKEAIISFFLNNADDIINLVDFGLNLTGQKDTSPENKNSRWKTVTKQAVEVAKGINANDIGKVTVNSLSLISSLIKTNNFVATYAPAFVQASQLIADYRNDPNSFKADTSKKKVKEAFELVNSIAFNDTELIQKLSHYTNFITDMANADSAAQIKDALNKYAAPVSSYRVNRESVSSFTLAAYPGVYVGWERIKSIKGVLNGGAFGVTAPIGFSLNLGTHHSESWSFFLSMVDIGAALSYRWDNDTTDIPTKITLGQIFSPGLHVVYGIKGSPLALKLGYQYAPALRKIDASIDPTTPTVGAWRLNFGLTADIPVFIFSTHPRNKPRKGQP